MFSARWLVLILNLFMELGRRATKGGGNGRVFWTTMLKNFLIENKKYEHEYDVFRTFSRNNDDG